MITTFLLLFTAGVIIAVVAAFLIPDKETKKEPLSEDEKEVLKQLRKNFKDLAQQIFPIITDKDGDKIPKKPYVKNPMESKMIMEKDFKDGKWQ